MQASQSGDLHLSHMFTTCTASHFREVDNDGEVGNMDILSRAVSPWAYWLTVKFSFILFLFNEAVSIAVSQYVSFAKPVFYKITKKSISKVTVWLCKKTYYISKRKFLPIKDMIKRRFMLGLCQRLFLIKVVSQLVQEEAQICVSIK